MGTDPRSFIPAALAALTLVVGLAATTARGPAPTLATPPPPAPVATSSPTLPPTPVPVDPIAEALQGRDACLLAEQDGRTVAAFRPDAALAPASTLKLLVAAGALELLGPQHRFATRALSDVPPAAGVVGDLWLVGGADPMLVTPEEAARRDANPRWRELRSTPLAALADGIVQAGVREVRGSVRGDASRHGGVGYLQAWPPRFVEGGDITPLSALAVDGGWVERDPQAVPAADPAVHAAAELTRLLRDRGVTVLGEPLASTAPISAASVASVESAPLIEVLVGILGASHNPGSEMLLREVGTVAAGRPGTTQDGAAALAGILSARGVDVAELRIVDGSGLSDASRVTCRTLVEVLGATFGGVRLPGLLAVAGRSGTLRHRYHDTPLEGALRGKTGWVRGVVSIAGTIETGGPVTVALLQNGVPTLSDGRDVESRVLHHLIGVP